MATPSKDSAQKHTITAKKRDVFGKKLKKVRREGEVPANIFGPGFTSLAVSLVQKDFAKVFSKAHETGIIFVTVDKQEIPTLVRQVQRHPLSREMLHVDLRKVDLTQKIEAEVPVKVVGESPAVTQQGGVLLTQANHLLVESLPADIPQEIEVDVSTITEIDGAIKVVDLAKGAKYVIKEEADKVIVSVIAHKEESLEPDTTSTIAEEGAEGEVPAEGETPAEGEAPAEGEKGDEKKETAEEKAPEKKAEDKKEE